MPVGCGGQLYRPLESTTSDLKVLCPSAPSGGYSYARVCVSVCYGGRFKSFVVGVVALVVETVTSPFLRSWSHFELWRAVSLLPSRLTERNSRGLRPSRFSNGGSVVFVIRWFCSIVADGVGGNTISHRTKMPEQPQGNRGWGTGVENPKGRSSCPRV